MKLLFLVLVAVVAIYAQKSCIYPMVGCKVDDVYCFDADTIVNTTKGFKEMSELRVGDAIQISHDKFMDVTGWFHRDETIEAYFYILFTETTRVTLSGEHIIKYSPGCDHDVTGYTPVNSLTEEDCLIVYDTETLEIRLENVQANYRQTKNGVYAPYLDNDEFLVFDGNTGVYVTPYAIKMPDDTEKMFVRWIMIFSDILCDQQEYQGINIVVRIMVNIFANYFSAY